MSMIHINRSGKIALLLAMVLIIGILPQSLIKLYAGQSDGLSTLPAVSEERRGEEAQADSITRKLPDDMAQSSYDKAIQWQFIIYGEPDFKSKRIAVFAPQTVRVIKTEDTGWAQIQTYIGDYWMYPEKNLYYIDKNTDLYADKNGEKTVGAISPQIAEITNRDGDWIQIETWLGAKWINPKLRLKSVLLDVPIYNQRDLGYNAGCEIVSFGMMVNFAAPAAISALVDEMPLDSDPDKGYRGNIRLLRDGFTIFPSALMGMADEYLGKGYDMSGCSADELKDQLAAGAPVVVWVNGLGFDVHAVCLTGYNDSGFYYNDPWTGAKNSFISNEKFYSAWNKPIYDKVYDIYYSSRKALSYYVADSWPGR